MESKNKLTSVKTAIRLSRQILTIASLKVLRILNNRDFDPFGDFFNDLNNFRPSNNTPPTPQPNQVEVTVEMAVMVPKIVDLLKLLHQAKKKAYWKNLVST